MKSLTRFGETILFVLTLLISLFHVIHPLGLRAFNCPVFFSPVLSDCASGTAWLEIIVLVLLTSLAVILLHQHQRLSMFINRWKRNWMICPFLLIAILSISWSNYPAAAIYRALFIFLITLIASATGTMYPLDKVIRLLSNSLVIMVGFCVILAIAIPGWGIMLDSPYNGSWRGIFWHRNYLGTFMALSCLVFTHNFLNEPNSKIKKVFFLLLSILAIILTILSRSATGIIVLLLVFMAELVASIWVRIYSKIKPVFYWVAGALGIILILVVMTNIDFLFGLLGRNASLTGRIPMWTHLMDNYVSTRPWMGFGIGSFWIHETIRNGVQTAVGWGYPVMIGDNGWMDILLQLGWVGLAAFLLVLIKVAFVSVKHLLSSRSKTSTFPLLFFLFVILSNISLSLFLEVEAFIWFVLISLLFSITNIPKSGNVLFQMPNQDN